MEPTPLTLQSAGALGVLAVAVWCAWHGLPLMARVFRAPAHPDAPVWFMRGGRSLIVAAGLTLLSGGLWWWSTAAMGLAAVFLAEEIYETGMALMILRLRGQPAPAWRVRPGAAGTPR